MLWTFGRRAFLPAGSLLPLASFPSASLRTAHEVSRVRSKQQQPSVGCRPSEPPTNGIVWYSGCFVLLTLRNLRVWRDRCPWQVLGISKHLVDAFGTAANTALLSGGGLKHRYSPIFVLVICG